MQSPSLQSGAAAPWPASAPHRTAVLDRLLSITAVHWQLAQAAARPAPVRRIAIARRGGAHPSPGLTAVQFAC